MNAQILWSSVLLLSKKKCDNCQWPSAGWYVLPPTIMGSRVSCGSSSTGWIYNFAIKKRVSEVNESSWKCFWYGQEGPRHRLGKLVISTFCFW